MVAIAGLAPRGLRAVTISEIHYDPPGESSGLEFIEVHNDGPTVADVSGWSFTEGVQCTFPRGTWIPGRGYIVVVADRTAFGEAHPLVPVAAEFTGRLESDGETLVLSSNGGGEIVRVDYRNRGKWPSVPAGTGHTLSLLRPNLDPGEPESWGASLQIGGTPGRENFPRGGYVETDLVPRGAEWSYRKGTEEFSSPPGLWRETGFAATGWLTGAAGFGYDDGDDATVLADMRDAYWSVAARRTFELTAAEAEAPGTLILSVNYDDGFVAYLNGVEAARGSMAGAPGTAVPFNTAAIGHEAGQWEEFEVPAGLLAAGQNVLAVQGHNTALSSSDLSLHPRLFRRESILADSPRVAFNEFLGRAAVNRWVELSNDGPAAVDLSGWRLSDDADDLGRYTLPPGSTLPPGGFLVVTEEAAGLDFAAPEVRLFLSLPDLSAVLAGAIFESIPADAPPADRSGHSDARIAGGAFGFAAAPTPGAPNAVEVETAIVLNEILYNPPLGDRGGEFIELHNRGESDVDIGGWSFTKGVTFAIPAGTVIPAGEYLVLAGDPAALEAAHGISGVLGPWVGALANGGENLRLVDATGNTADEVRYHDGGRWSRWADGGGSSLELIDPRQDNSFASAWERSDESSKAPWTRVSYSGAYAVEAQSEIHFILIDEGAVLIDDVSLQRQGDPLEHLQNGGFEQTTVPWVFSGTHVSSRRVSHDAHSGSACLEISSSGSGDDGVNKVEVDTSPVMSGGTYTLSFWARWVRGSDKLLTRADARRGASLSRVTTLALPGALGTPGRKNGARAALEASSPGGNLGPVIDGVTQVPASPGAATPVTVLARAMDWDGIDRLTVRYRTGGVGDGVFAEAAMLDDGSQGDGKAADGLYAGTVPPFPQGTRVLFYIEGADDLGAIRRYPVDAPATTLLYAVEGRDGSPLHVARLNIDDDNMSRLANRPLHSDELVDGSFVFNDEEIYYNVGVRYRGSPWNRPPDPKMFRVRFGDDRPFERGWKAIDLSRYPSWSGQTESTAYFCVQGASRPHAPAPVGDYLYTRVYWNTSFHALMGIIEPVNSGYLEKWFPADSDGYLFKIPGRRYMNDANTLDGVEWTTFGYRPSLAGYAHEGYRWFFVPNSNVLENRWSDLDALCSIMDVNRVPPGGFDAEIQEILDVEQFLRVEAARVMQDDWDTIGIGNGQNAYVYFAPLEGRWKLIAWDMDHTFGNASAKLYPEGSEAQITRLVQRPIFRRIYLRIISEMLSTVWDPAYIGPLLAQVQSATGLDPSGIMNFINTRRPALAAQVPAGVAFRATRIGTLTIPADWDGQHATERTLERLQGTAPVTVASIAVLRDDETIDAAVLWPGLTTWAIDLVIPPGETRFEVLAFGSAGELIGVVSFSVLNTQGWLPPVVSSVEPASGPPAGGTAVEIGGAEIRPGARIFFGEVEATGIAVLSSTEARAFSPAGTGTVAVRIENMDGQSGNLPAAFEYAVPAVTFIRGDSTRDGKVDISDPIRTLGHLFLGEAISCRDAADTDDSGQIDITDPIGLLNFLFASGTAPAEPHPLPGTDPSLPADDLDCAS
jgi:hypothetical protein